MIRRLWRESGHRGDVLLCICETGKFQEVMLVKGEKDLQRFMEMYGLEKVDKEY
jgi:hypothetical protein